MKLIIYTFFISLGLSLKLISYAFCTLNQEFKLKMKITELESKQDDLTLLKLEHRQEMKKRDESMKIIKNQLQTIESSLSLADQTTRNKLAESG